MAQFRGTIRGQRGEEATVQSRLVPTGMIGVRGNTMFNCKVVSVTAFQPGKHPKGAPIKPDYVCLQCVLDSGISRWFGVRKAWIGSDLRMHVDEESGAVHHWPKSNEEE